MVSMPLFDRILSEDRMDNSAMVATELIQSALDDIRHIENLDESLAPDNRAKFDRQTVFLVHQMYEEWAKSTETLLDRLTGLERRQGPLAGSNDLRDAHGRVRAMLTISIDRLEEDHRLAQMPGISVQEVRRELRLGTH
jgi:hypothetical protein